MTERVEALFSQRIDFANRHEAIAVIFKTEFALCKTETSYEELIDGGVRTFAVIVFTFESIAIAGHQLLPRKAPSFAVERKYGIGSSVLIDDVKAFERDHIVRGANASCSGAK